MIFRTRSRAAGGSDTGKVATMWSTRGGVAMSGRRVAAAPNRSDRLAASANTPATMSPVSSGLLRPGGCSAGGRGSVSFALRLKARLISRKVNSSSGSPLGEGASKASP